MSRRTCRDVARTTGLLTGRLAELPVTLLLATLLLATLLLGSGCDIRFFPRSNSRSGGSRDDGRAEMSRPPRERARSEVTVRQHVAVEPVARRTEPRRRAVPVTVESPGTRSTVSALSQAWQIDEWEPRFRGVEQARFGTLKPRRMRGVALRIDLREPGIEFLSTPSNGDRPQETDGLKTSTFLEEYRCQAAINAAPFWPIWGQEKKGVDIKGLSISRGELVSPPSSYPALLITKDNRATIAGPPFDLDEVYTAVCGFSVALEDGEPVRGSGNTHPRVGAGVSKDGRYLYLVVIDGRQYHHSIGATRHELGQWLRRLGAWNGLNLDGGGTATMCVAGARGQAIVVNRPIHQGRPGNERVSGSHLGVKARPLE